MMLQILLLSFLSPILTAPMCGIFCDGQTGASAGYTQPGFQNFNDQFQRMNQNMIQQQQQQPMYVQRSSGYHRPRTPMFQRVEMVEAVQPVETVQQQAPMEAMFAHHSSMSSSSSSMGYVKQPGTVVTRTQPIRMEPLKQPCEYTDPCAY